MTPSYTFERRGKSPSVPSDLFGVPLNVGDWFVSPTKNGSSSAEMIVGRIDSFVFKREWNEAERQAARAKGKYLDGYTTCPADEAEWYLIRYHSTRYDYKTQRELPPRDDQKPNMIQNVWNAVKVDTGHVQEMFLRYEMTVDTSRYA